MYRIASTALLILGLSQQIAAQQHPDFSGMWVMDPARSDSAKATDGTRIASASVNIVQNDREVRIEDTRNGVQQTLLYGAAVDGSPRAVGTSGDGAAIDETPSAVGTSGRSSTSESMRAAEAVPGIFGTKRTGVSVKFDRGTMVTYTTYQVNGQTVTTTERRTLSSDGREMTVVSQLQVQHGYAAGPNTSTPSTDVYVRDLP